MKTYHSFKVQGKGHFPFDMLRYDCCWPSSSEDVVKLHAIEDTRTIVLMGEHAPTDARWSSFGWQVVEVYKITSFTGQRKRVR